MSVKLTSGVELGETEVPVFLRIPCAFLITHICLVLKAGTQHSSNASRQNCSKVALLFDEGHAKSQVDDALSMVDLDSSRAQTKRLV